MANDVSTKINIQTQVNGTDQVDNLKKSILELQKQLQNLVSSAAGADSFNKLDKSISNTIDEINKLKKLGVSDSKLFNDLNQMEETLQSIQKSANFNNTAINSGSSNKGIGIDLNKVSEEWDKYLSGSKEVESNNNKLIDSLLKIASTGNISTTSIKSLATSMGATAAEVAPLVAAFTALGFVLKEIGKATDEVLGYFKRFAGSTADFLADLGTSSIDLFIAGLKGIKDSFIDLLTACDSAIKKVQEFSDLGANLQNALFRIYQYTGGEAGESLIKYTDSLSMALGLDTEVLYKGLKGILAVTTQITDNRKDVEKYTKALTNLSVELSTFSGESIESISGQFENAINLGVLNSRSAIAKALDLNDDDIKQFKELNTQLERANFILSKGSVIQGTYSDYLDTAVGKVTALKNAWKNFNDTIGAVILQLYARLAPILTEIINLATLAVKTLAKLFGLDITSAFNNKAIDNTARYADNIGNIGDEAEKTGKKVKEATKKVASFDDVIQISDDKNNTDSVSDALKDIQNYDASDFSDLFDGLIDDADNAGFSIDSLKDKIKELLDRFKNWEEGLDWTDLRNKAADFGKTLAELANIIVDDERAWKDFGNLIGNSINVGLEALNAFAKEFHFEQFGKDLAVAWNEMWDELDEDLAADTIYNWLTGALKTAIGFFKESPLTNAADSISTIFANLINKLSSLDATATINEFIDSLFKDVNGAINKVLDNFDENNTSEKIIAIVKNIFLKLGENLPETIETLARLITSLLDTIGGSIAAAIDGLFTGIESDPDGVNKIINSIISVVDSVFANIGKIGDAINNHKDTIIQLISGVIDKALENSEEWGKNLAPIVDAIISILRSLDWSKIREIINTILDQVDIAGLISAYLATKWQLQWTAFTTMFRIGWDTFWSNVAGGLKTLFVDPVVALFGMIGDLFTAGVNNFLNFRNDVQNGMDELCNNIEEGASNLLTGLKTILSNIWNTIRTIIENIKTGIGNGVTFITQKLTNIKTSITNIFNSIKNTISSVIESIKKIVKSGINVIIDSLNKIKFDIPDWVPNFGGKSFGFDIPRLATGGIVDSSTLVNIGENGAEAVLPLEKNTAWMDQLASILAAKLNNSNSQNNNNVEIKLSSKNFYTRSEMLDFAEQVVTALRAYGVNVSVAY
jgi:phage-related protein